MSSLRWTIIALTLLLQACATQSTLDPTLLSFDQSKLPPTDVSLNIPGLGPCTDNPDRTLRLNSQQPVTLLVHGCFGSSGQFRGLAQVLAFHGQQTACFTYDDRASLVLTATELASSIDQLVKQTKPSAQITIVGHSQGALIARKSLTAGQPKPIGASDTKLKLVTISGPFAGIAAADDCGSPLIRALSLGLIVPLCKIATGDKWSEITYSSNFILLPGPLSKQVQSHLKIDTDERDSCRRKENDRCVESDFIFSLKEQRNPTVDGDPAANVQEVKAGHVEIVGDQRVAPVKLISVLQQNGVILPTEPQRATAFKQLLARVYQDDSFKAKPQSSLLFGKW